VVSPELHAQLQRIKGLLAHTLPNATYADLLQYMATETLTRLERKKGIAPKSPENNGLTQATIVAAVTPSPKAALPTGQRVYLPAAIRHGIFRRSGGQCEYQAQGRRCTSRHRLEIDHTTPLALNGSNQLENLRVLCGSHNAQQALEKLSASNVWMHGRSNR
jgi:5-methylcytosine-specific restriction endonuclease McrA